MTSDLPIPIPPKKADTSDVPINQHRQESAFLSNRHRQTLKESASAKFADTKAGADSLSITSLQELHSML